MPKFSCVDNNETEIGIIVAKDAEEALAKAQKMNENIREVRQKEEPAVTDVKAAKRAQQANG